MGRIYGALQLQWRRWHEVDERQASTVSIQADGRKHLRMCPRCLFPSSMASPAIIQLLQPQHGLALLMLPCSGRYTIDVHAFSAESALAPWMHYACSMHWRYLALITSAIDENIGGNSTTAPYTLISVANRYDDNGNHARSCTYLSMLELFIPQNINHCLHGIHAYTSIYTLINPGM